MIRAVLLLVLLAVLVWAWWRGERELRSDRAKLPILCRSCLDAYSAMWRLLMLSITAVSIIAVVGLWSAQDASDRARGASAYSIALTANLCAQNRDWQASAIDARQADVRIATGELVNARAELQDAEVATAEAQALGVYDNQFVASFLTRETARAKQRVEQLELELERRTESVEDFRETALDECPPISD